MKKMLPNKVQQITLTHAKLIHHVVMACGDVTKIAELEPALQSAEKNGWKVLVQRIRKILAGQRGSQLLKQLDEEDYVIIRAILEGIQNPESLPDMTQQRDANMAAPSLAAMIDVARKGDASALQVLADMAEQMTQTEGSMRQLGGALRYLVQGEWEIKILTRGMDEKGKKLISDIIDELHKLNSQ